VALLGWPRGSRIIPIELLAHTPFTSFVAPALLLALVVGGTSLACAILASRRSRGAVDATLLAGGALVVWIAAELAQMRTVHWLHVVYGGLGLALLALGVGAAARVHHPRHRWVIAVTAAEAAGYLAPAVTGVLATRAGLGEVPRAVLIVAAGLVEGLALGAGQAWAWPLPVRRWRYAVLTSLGAGAVWASVMATMILTGSGVGPGLAVMAGLGTGAIGLIAIGGAQWLELRHHTKGAERWIGWTAVAWVCALPLSFSPGPLVDDATPLAPMVVLWACGGLLMAYVMALITWQGVRRVAARNGRAV